MGKSSAPDSPDYSGLAAQQGAQNRATALWNTQLGRVNTIGPTGSTTWNGNTLTTNLSPEQQQQFNYQNRLGMQAGGQLDSAMTRAQTGINYSGIPGMQYNVDSAVGEDARQAATNAVYNQYAQNLDPQFQRAETDLETKLVNQGFDPNSDAYKEQMASFARNKAGAYQQANNAAVQQGLGAQQQAYQQAQGNAQLNNTSRASAIQELMQRHATDQGDVNWLRSLMQVQQPSGAQGTAGNAAPTDLMGAANSGYQAALNGANVSNANASNTWGTLGSMGALAAMYFSDERLKSNIGRIGETSEGIPLYEYDIGDRRERGVLAQEVERLRPDAVKQHPSGFKMVDYAKVGSF